MPFADEVWLVQRHFQLLPKWIFFRLDEVEYIGPLFSTAMDAMS